MKTKLLETGKNKKKEFTFYIYHVINSYSQLDYKNIHSILIFTLILQI